MEKNREIRKAQRLGRWNLAAAALGAVLVASMLAATQARADSNFERGFETEMGRIVAHETVNLGKQVLAHAGGVSYAVHTTYRSAPYRDDYTPPRRYPQPPRYAERGHRKHVKRHHRRHHHHRRNHPHWLDCRGRY